MTMYPISTIAAMADAYERAGVDVRALINANAKALQSLAASPLNAGTPSPIPQKAYEDGSNPQEQKCADVAYILYQIDLLKPGVNPQQAKEDYCANHAACFAE